MKRFKPPNTTNTQNVGVHCKRPNKMSDFINISEETAFTFQVYYNDFIITKKYGDKEEKISATGIIFKPHWVEVKPTNFRSNIVLKKDSGYSNDRIYNDLTNGIYYLNIKDYSEQELKIACDYLTSKWTEEVWISLTKKDEDVLIKLDNNKLVELILKGNEMLFKTEKDINEFCTNNGIEIENFLLPAKYSLLQIKLKEISLRLEMEQFFARRFLFTESLIYKLKTRIRDYTKNNSIEEDKILELNNWIIDINERNRIFQQYKNYQQLYDMPKQEINIKKSKNINFLNGDITDSTIKITDSKKDTKNSQFEKRVKIIMVVLGILTIIVTLIINWDKIMTLIE